MAPTRADLSGGTLDLWPIYCAVGGGRTINVALDLWASVTFEVLPSVVFKMEIESFGNQKCSFEEPMTADEIRKLPASVQFPAFVASHFLRQQDGLPEQCIQMKLETLAPLRSGLGGSSTLAVAMVRGFGRIFNQFVEQGWQWRLLEWVRDCEAAFLNTPTGTQDYLAALFGGLKSYTSEVGGIRLDEYSDSVREGLKERLLVIFSGEMHSSGLSNWELYKAAMEGNADVMRGFHAIQAISEKLHLELSSRVVNWKNIGACLNEEWKTRQQVFKVHTPRLNEIVDFLSQQKVLGRKVCGAAQGGSLIALVEPDHRERVIKACEQTGIQILKASPAAQGVHILSGPEQLWTGSSKPAKKKKIDRHSDII